MIMKQYARPDKEFDADFFRSVNHICSLHFLALVLHIWEEEDRNSNLDNDIPLNLKFKAQQCPRTAKTASLPRRALTREALSTESPLTTSTPRALSFLDASESGSREIARGTNVPSLSKASTTAEPGLAGVRTVILWLMRDKIR